MNPKTQKSKPTLRVDEETRLLKENVLSVLARRLGSSVDDLTFLFGVNNSIDGLKIPDRRRN